MNNTFTPNRRFRRVYDCLFRTDPATANVMLLLCELAYERGEVYLGAYPEVGLQRLMAGRFNDPRAYQMGGSKR
jgi:hypothetical protein